MSNSFDLVDVTGESKITVYKTSELVGELIAWMKENGVDTDTVRAETVCVDRSNATISYSRVFYDGGAGLPSYKRRVVYRTEKLTPYPSSVHEALFGDVTDE